MCSVGWSAASLASSRRPASGVSQTGTTKMSVDIIPVEQNTLISENK